MKFIVLNLVADVFAEQSCTGQQAPLRISPPFISEPNELRLNYNGNRYFNVQNAHSHLALAAQDMGNVEYRGEKYTAEYMELHSPAEHKIGNADELPLEIQIIHRSDKGKSLGIALLFQNNNEGSYTLQQILSAMGEDHVHNHVAALDLSKYIGNASNYFSYSTIKCSGTHSPVDQWLILTKVKKVSSQQIALLQKFVPRLSASSRKEAFRLPNTQIARSAKRQSLPANPNLALVAKGTVSHATNGVISPLPSNIPLGPPQGQLTIPTIPAADAPNQAKEAMMMAQQAAMEAQQSQALQMQQMEAQQKLQAQMLGLGQQQQALTNVSQGQQDMIKDQNEAQQLATNAETMQKQYQEWMKQYQAYQQVLQNNGYVIPTSAQQSGTLPPPIAPIMAQVNPVQMPTAPMQNINAAPISPPVPVTLKIPTQGLIESNAQVHPVISALTPPVLNQQPATPETVAYQQQYANWLKQMQLYQSALKGTPWAQQIPIPQLSNLIPQSQIPVQPPSVAALQASLPLPMEPPTLAPDQTMNQNFPPPVSSAFLQPNPPMVAAPLPPIPSAFPNAMLQTNGLATESNAAKNFRERELADQKWEERLKQEEAALREMTTTKRRHMEKEVVELPSSAVTIPISPHPKILLQTSPIRTENQKMIVAAPVLTSVETHHVPEEKISSAPMVAPVANNSLPPPPGIPTTGSVATVLQSVNSVTTSKQVPLVGTPLIPNPLSQINPAITAAAPPAVVNPQSTPVVVPNPQITPASVTVTPPILQAPIVEQTIPSPHAAKQFEDLPPLPPQPEFSLPAISLMQWRMKLKRKQLQKESKHSNTTDVVMKKNPNNTLLQTGMKTHTAIKKHVSDKRELAAGGNDLHIIKAAMVQGGAVAQSEAPSTTDEDAQSKPKDSGEDASATVLEDHLGEYADNDDLEEILLQQGTKSKKIKFHDVTIAVK